MASHTISSCTCWTTTTHGRSEQIQFTNASTGAVLSTQTVSSFSAGVYMNWTISGNVDIRFTNEGPANAVLSGLFLDPVSAAVPAATATFLAKNATTQGNWIGTYGSLGYDVIGNASSMPSYAPVGISGASTFIWSSSATAPQALQKAGGTGRIAACLYSATSFTVDVDITNGQSYNIELYLLDYDNRGRSEQIQFMNASTVLC